VSVEERRDGNGRVVEATARWRDPSGAQRKRTFKGSGCLRDARAHEAEMTAAAKTGDYIAPSRQTVHELAVDYVANRPYRGESRRRNEARVKALGETPLGRMRVQQARASHVQSWATRRAAELAPSTMRVELQFVRSVFLAAVDDGTIRRTPVPRRIALPTEEGDEKLLPYSPAEIELIASKLPPRLRLLPYLQAGVGPRIGEALALRVPHDVDHLGRVVRVREQLHPTRRTREPVKSKASSRDVPLPTTTSERIARHIEAYGLGPDGELFTMDDGVTLWAYNRVREYVNGALEAAGARGNAGGPTHAFRHTYASTLLAAGCSVIEVAERLGHANGALVLSTYGHLLEGADAKTRKAIDDAWSAKSAPDVPEEGGSTR
jgi:integrase